MSRKGSLKQDFLDTLCGEVGAELSNPVMILLPVRKALL
jgi:hypothetical protein